MNELLLRNRQRTRLVNLPLLRRVARALLAELGGAENGAMGVHLVAAPEMIRLNQRFLNHAESTDVIAFDYRDDSNGGSPASAPAGIHGEIFICLDDVVANARQFGASWPSELVRCLVHGTLHLSGYDDVRPELRRVMKREEGRLLRGLSERHPLGRIAGPTASAVRSGRRERKRGKRSTSLR